MNRTRVLLVLVATVALAAGATTMIAAAEPLSKAGPPTAYQVKLRGLVDDPTGGPRQGRDPARQKQTGLAAAASQAVGNGTRGGRPASAAVADHAHDVHPGEVLPDPASGRLASGCATGYGIPGQQCLSPMGPKNTGLTCAHVLKTFPSGIAVVGKDKFELDSNRDGVACGPGDRR